jgi:hypothetical protein
MYAEFPEACVAAEMEESLTTSSCQSSVDLTQETVQ